MSQVVQQVIIINNARKLIVLGILLINLSSFGCVRKMPKVTVETISESLFRGVVHVWISVNESSNFQELSQNEITILRNSIRNAKNMAEISNANMRKVKKTVTFDIRWRKNYGGNLFYEPSTNYFYVDKDTVFHDEFNSFSKNTQLTQKYLLGTYCFQSSPEINKLLKKK